jgi:hypothetical protein
VAYVGHVDPKPDTVGSAAVVYLYPVRVPPNSTDCPSVLRDMNTKHRGKPLPHSNNGKDNLQMTPTGEAGAPDDIAPQAELWARHHTICLLAAICDCALAGKRLSGEWTEFSANPRLVNAPRRVLRQCPWILDERYFEFVQSANKAGSELDFVGWAFKEILMMYGIGGMVGRHPSDRVEYSLCVIYPKFRETFLLHVTSESPIKEVDARQFWLSSSSAGGPEADFLS